MSSEKVQETTEHVGNTGDLVQAALAEEQLVVTEAEEKVQLIVRLCDT
jgi:hypothetical protein